MNAGKPTYLTLLYIKMINQTPFIPQNELSAFRRYHAFICKKINYEASWNQNHVVPASMELRGCFHH